MRAKLILFTALIVALAIPASANGLDLKRVKTKVSDGNARVASSAARGNGGHYKTLTIVANVKGAKKLRSASLIGSRAYYKDSKGRFVSDLTVPVPAGAGKRDCWPEIFLLKGKQRKREITRQVCFRL